MCGHVSGEGGCVLMHTKTRRRASHHVLSVLWELLPPPSIWSPPFIKEKSDTVVGRTREKSGCVMGVGRRPAHPKVLHSIPWCPLLPPTRFCFCLPLQREKEWSAEQEGRLRRSVDLAVGWAGGMQASLGPPGPWCSGPWLVWGGWRTPPLYVPAQSP